MMLGLTGSADERAEQGGAAGLVLGEGVVVLGLEAGGTRCWSGSSCRSRRSTRTRSPAGAGGCTSRCPGAGGPLALSGEDRAELERLARSEEPRLAERADHLGVRGVG
jgi:hypothetical protein